MNYNIIPSLNEILTVLDEVDKLYYPLHYQFPRLCFQGSLLAYIWIKRHDKCVKCDLVVGQYNSLNNKKLEDSVLHIWIEYNNSIIDYTHIQFEEEIYEDPYISFDDLKKKYDISIYHYVFDKNDIRYSETCEVMLVPALERVICELENYELEITFNEFCDLFIKMIIDFRNIKNTNFIDIFNMSVQAFLWYDRYDDSLIERLIRECGLSIDNYCDFFRKRL